MWRYFDTMQATLERHGGTVEKFIGDAIVAVFGVPAVTRTMRSAPSGGVRDAGGSRAAQRDLAREYGVRIETRTGVNTGEVIVGDAAADQKLATGDAVNVAARLEQAAETGEFSRRGDYRLVRDAVVAEPAPPVVAKGKSRPLAAWRLLGLRPDAPAFARPIATPFIGRDARARRAPRRLRRLRRASLRAASPRSSGRPASASPALRARLSRSFEREARVVVGRCVAYGEGITYLPLAEVVREVAGADPEPELEDSWRTSSAARSRRD